MGAELAPTFVAAPHPQAGRGGRWAFAATVCFLFVVVLSVLAPASAQSPAPLAVEITNASEPVLCAEKDNVTINLQSKDVRRFRIEAAHPAYIGTIQRDSFEADWTGMHCDWRSESRHAAATQAHHAL